MAAGDRFGIEPEEDITRYGEEQFHEELAIEIERHENGAQRHVGIVEARRFADQQEVLVVEKHHHQGRHAAQDIQLVEAGLVRMECGV